MPDGYDIAREITDQTFGEGAYAEMNKDNPNPGVQAAINRLRKEEDTKLANQLEKIKEVTEWMQYLIDNFIAPTGRVCNGRMEASGEEPGDHWLLKVENNVVSGVQAKVVYEEK